MNSKYFQLAIAVWIFAVVPFSFAETLPEAYSNRETQTNMDQTAAMGADITRGLYERCLVVQVDPLSFAVPNKIGWYLDQSTRAAVDDKVKALVPSYVNTNTLYDGTTNIAMLTISNLWKDLPIGDHTNKFTGTPAIGTNPPTYGDYPWRIYATNLLERYKVIRAQEQTISAVNHVIEGSYRGHGVGATAQQAYDAAVASYDWVQHTTTTNLTVTGDLEPNVTGSYIEVIPGIQWNRTPGSGYISFDPLTKYRLRSGGSPNYFWYSTVLAGDYTPLSGIGIAHVALDIVQTGEINPATEYNQHCKIAYWNNFRVQGGSGRTNENPNPYDGTETTNVWHDPVWWYDDLQVDAVIAGKITVASSGITELVTYTYTTNLIVTGEDLNPNVTGTYIETIPVWRWDCVGVGTVEYMLGWWRLKAASGNARWIHSGGISAVEGSYYPFDDTATGIASAALSVAETITTNAATPVDYSGTYYPTFADEIWQGTPGYLFLTNGSYYIYSSLTLDTNAAYLVNGTLEGNYSAVNFVATTTVSEDSGGAPPCVGTYSGVDPDWVMGAWSRGLLDGDGWISQNGNTTSGWLKSGSGPVGTYSPSGTGAYGDVTATFVSYDHPGYWTTEPVYHTHNDGITNTIFYECWLTKVAAKETYSSLITNIEHRVRFWVWPTKPTYGTTNTFNNQDLGVTETNWNANAVGNWTDWTFENLSVLENYWTAKLSTPPDPSPEPITVNTTTCSGFRALKWIGIGEWHFQYCTDE